MNRHKMHPLQRLVADHKLAKERGVYSVCSANPLALEAAVCQAKRDGSLLLVEATSNQVDQFGGYTGMTPREFVEFLTGIRSALSFPGDRLILGGDHLGPNTWRNENSETAMRKARDLVAAYVEAGFTKIHLDTSMRCCDDPGTASTPLDEEIVARRAAELCRTAESIARRESLERLPVYVLGTEVPPPGGARENLTGLSVTRAEDARSTISRHRRAFRDCGLDRTWERVVALVVQPGVEFGDSTVAEYNRRAAAGLSSLIEEFDALVYEAHSTDYQTRTSLRQMVQDHFAILKVGPALTFALREALFALCQIESEWLGGRKASTLSGLPQLLEQIMIENARHWTGFYQGDAPAQRIARKYSFSDRSRYYWPDPRLQEGIQRLLHNLEAHPPPLTLLSQYLPRQYSALRSREIDNTPRSLIRHGIMEVTADYSFACGN